MHRYSQLLKGKLSQAVASMLAAQPHTRLLLEIIRFQPERLFAKDLIPTSSFRFRRVGRRVYSGSSKHIRPAGRTSRRPPPLGRVKQRNESLNWNGVITKGLQARADLANASENLDIRHVIESYRALPSTLDLSAEELQGLTKCALRCLRLEKERISKLSGKPKEEDLRDTDAIVSFTTQLAKDIQNRKLPAHATANVDILTIFLLANAEEEGVRFWKWLETQGNEYTTLGVYAAAIDLLVSHGSPLKELEELYQRALALDPATFLAYHLSPEAIVPDRDQRINLRIPKSLLGSIIKARLRHGDFRNAYLGLDSMFRLHPAEVRIYWILQFLSQRPASEQYTVFAMACCSGISLPFNEFSVFLLALRESSDLTSLRLQLYSIRAMVAAMYLQLCARGQITDRPLSHLVIAITQLVRLPEMKSIGDMQRKQAVASILELVKKTLEIFARYGAKPDVSAFSSIIFNIGGHGQAKDIIGVTMSDMKALGIEPTDSTHRSILSSGGLLRDKRIVTSAWEAFVQSRAARGVRLHPRDLSVLITAARHADCLDFAQQQFNELEKDFPSATLASVASYLADSRSSTNEGSITQAIHVDSLQQTGSEESASSKTTDFDCIESALAKIKADLQVLDERTRDRSAIHDFSSQPQPLNLIPMPEELSIPEQDMRLIYDELTTEQRPGSTITDKANLTHEQSSKPAGSSPAMSSTNLSYGTLRYESWKAINFLLHLAEINEREYRKGVGEAHTARERHPERNKRLWTNDPKSLSDFGLSSLAGHDLKAPVLSNSSLGNNTRAQNARKEILRLRGRVESSSAARPLMSTT